MDIQLIEITDELRISVLSGAQALSTKLGLSVPAGWPIFQDIFLRPITAGWPLFLFVDPIEKSILGSGGFLSASDERDRVQIGYEIAPQYRSRGIATQAMKNVLSLRPDTQFAAFTEHSTGASASVLYKLGLSISGSIQSPDSACMYLCASHASAA